MSREVCGICWCPYDEFTGDCACPPASVQKSTQPRKPLSIEQILDLFDAHNVYGTKWLEFARAVERAHGIGPAIKNE